MSSQVESHTLPDLCLQPVTSSKPDTPVQQFYSGANIFITGGSGFMGKVLIEKLLRSFPEVDHIYLLMREKRGCCVEDRMDAIFNDKLFSKLGRMLPQYRAKVTAVSGDCSQPGLGLSDHERHLLIREVDIVFHGAATVRFDETLKVAVAINVNGTRDVLSLAKRMKKLKALVHVSTAYSNCNRQDVDEIFYDPPMTHEAMTNLVNATSDELLQRLTPVLLDEWPNTYTMTKAIAENLISREGAGLPLVVFRPSIVVGIKDDPLPGWVDNMYGASGTTIAIATGVMKSMNGDPDAISDIVPVDMAISAMIAAAWDVGSNTKHATSEDISIYNYVSSVETPLLLRECNRLLKVHWLPVPPLKSYWRQCMTFNKYYWIHWLSSMMFHFLPALFVDSALVLVGQKPWMWKTCTKIEHLSKVLSFFITRSWKFSNSNVQALWLRLSEEDKKLFMFDMKQVNWSDFFYSYVRGCRVYLLKDDLSTVPQALERQKLLFWVQQAVRVTLLVGLMSVAWSATSITSPSSYWQQ